MFKKNNSPNDAVPLNLLSSFSFGTDTHQYNICQNFQSNLDRKCSNTPHCKVSTGAHKGTKFYLAAGFDCIVVGGWGGAGVSERMGDSDPRLVSGTSSGRRRSEGWKWDSLSCATWEKRINSLQHCIMFCNYYYS